MPDPYPSKRKARAAIDDGLAAYSIEVERREQVAIVHPHPDGAAMSMVQAAFAAAAEYIDTEAARGAVPVRLVFEYMGVEFTATAAPTDN